MNLELELLVLLRLCVAAVLGGIVGFERTYTGKRAGLRTHMLVAIGAALYMSTADLGVDWARGATPRDSEFRSILQVQIAVLSPVQAIATGIGFLGAGTIFLAGDQHRVHGLTTAASIWVIAAVGIAVGCDRYLLATGAAVLTLIILHLLIKLEPEHPRHGEQSPTATAGGGHP